MLAMFLFLFSITGAQAQPLDVKSVTAGSEHTCALTTDGTAYCWGSNEYRQSIAPKDVKFTMINAGSYHTCGLTTEGKTRCWGWFNNSHLPVRLPELDSLTSGERGTCGTAKSNKEYWCWGSEFYSQYPFPTYAGKIDTVALGNRYACGNSENRGIVCWGENWDLIDDIPQGITRANSFALGDQHACALDDQGLLCWGTGLHEWQSTKVPTDLGTIKDFSLGDRHTCALKTDGTVRCWGAYTEALNVPQDLANVESFESGHFHVCAVAKGEGRNGLVCWGSNQNKEIDVPAQLRL